MGTVFLIFLRRDAMSIPHYIEHEIFLAAIIMFLKVICWIVLLKSSIIVYPYNYKNEENQFNNGNNIYILRLPRRLPEQELIEEMLQRKVQLNHCDDHRLIQIMRSFSEFFVQHFLLLAYFFWLCCFFFKLSNLHSLVDCIMHVIIES